MQNNKKIWTVTLLLKWASEYLSSYKIQDAFMEAEYLLMYVLDCNRKEILLDPDKVLSNEKVMRFTDFIYRRGRREPAHYIIGEVEFCGLIFKINKDVLIPRPETESLVEEAIGLSLKEVTVLDLCTGSGCIAISIAKGLPAGRVYAVDISEGAVNIAKENAERNGVEDRITFLAGDLFKAMEGIGMEGKFDLIVSNPPYVSKIEMEALQPEIKDYEPVLALYGGEDGLDFYRKIIHEAPRYFSPSGILIMELGYGMADVVRDLLEKEGCYNRVEIKKDIAGIDRIIKAYYSVYL